MVKQERIVIGGGEFVRSEVVASYAKLRRLKDSEVVSLLNRKSRLMWEYQAGMVVLSVD